MEPCQSPTRIGVVHQRRIGTDHLPNYHDMAAPSRHHASSGLSRWEPEPVGCQIQVRNATAEDFDGSPATAEGPTGTAGWVRKYRGYGV